MKKLKEIIKEFVSPKKKSDNHPKTVIASEPYNKLYDRMPVRPNTKDDRGIPHPSFHAGEQAYHLHDGSIYTSKNNYFHGQILDVDHHENRVIHDPNHANQSLEDLSKSVEKQEDSRRNKRPPTL